MKMSKKPILSKEQRAAIVDQIKNMKTGEVAHINTELSAQQMTNRLLGIEDDDGNSKLYRCHTIVKGQCVAVTCTGSFKITNVRVVDRSEY